MTIGKKYSGKYRKGDRGGGFIEPMGSDIPPYARNTYIPIRKGHDPKLNDGDDVTFVMAGSEFEPFAKDIVKA